MEPLHPGEQAPPVTGLEPAGPTALVFYKVTCPACHMAAPKIGGFARAHPGRVFGVGQDPRPKLSEFETAFGMDVGSVADLAPYPVSDAYGVRTVPTAFLIDEGSVVDVVEGWDRDGLNRLAARMADLTGEPNTPVSEEGDGLPAFRPG